MPSMAPSRTSACEKQLCSRRLTPASATISQQTIVPAFATHRVADALPAVGIESRGVADRVRPGADIEVVEAPARPFAPHGRVMAALFLRRIDRQPSSRQPFDD